MNCSETLEKRATRPEGSVFYKRGDKNDTRLGEVVETDPKKFDEAEIVILGFPQDKGVERNKGRVGASAAPLEIRRSFYKLAAFSQCLSSELEGERLKIFDAGDSNVVGSLEEIHENHYELVKMILSAGKKLIVLGGGNDISYPDGHALASVYGANSIVSFNVDAHFDVREDQQRNSGTPYRQLLSEKSLLPTNFFEIGYQQFANSPVYEKYLRDLGVCCLSIEDVNERGGLTGTIRELLFSIPQELEEGPVHLFWGLDMDAVTASDAPGVSAMNAAGISGIDWVNAAKIMGSDRRSRIFEISEVNPKYDIDGRTSRLAAIGMYNFISGFLKSRTDQQGW